MIDISTLDPTQLLAVQGACGSSRLMCVTGPAGTGKTTIIRVAAQLLTDSGHSVALAAPTGKAAKRIKEATGLPAQTIHRLLEFSSPGEINPETGERTLVSIPKRTRENPLDYDVVIVDEYAMVPTGLHRQLIDALGRGCKLRCFGDVNQLSPIEDEDRESPFRGLLRTKDFPVVELATIHRHGEGSAIVANGMRILKGMVPIPAPGSFAIRVDEHPLSALTKALGTLPTGLFDGLDHQLITTQRVGMLGTHKLNQVMVDFYKPTAPLYTEVEAPSWEVKKGRPRVTRFYEGQKVILTQNLYDLRPTVSERYEGDSLIRAMPHEQVFNGESGLVVNIDYTGDITIDLTDRLVTIPKYLEHERKDGTIGSSDPRVHVEHGYAITTHKAQGSEYEGIIYFLAAASRWGQCRSNFYTGITRAKRQVVVISDRRSLQGFSLRSEIPRR